MKYKRTKATGKVGALVVEKIVNEHGSVFRPVHEEDDLGIDGFIELVKAEVASGRLIGVQVKTGKSYITASGDGFAVNVDQAHLDYWLDYMVPVIMVCHDPSTNTTAWVSVRDYVEHERYHDRLPVKKILVPFHEKFDSAALSKSIAGLAHARADERVLLRSADMCLSSDATTRHTGFQILANHPDSRDLKVTCMVARQLLMDSNTDTAKDALYILGYGVGRQRWSFNPNNRDERNVTSYAHDLCKDLSEAEIKRLLELCDDEAFHGPQGLGERLCDVCGCCGDTALAVFDRVARDRSQPIQRRLNALYLDSGCDDELLEEAKDQLLADADLKDLAEMMFSADEVIEPSSRAPTGE